MRNVKEHQSARDVFASRVREARKRRGLTQQQLADRVGRMLGSRVDRVTVAKIEGGSRATVTLEEVFAFALALNVAPVHLLVPLDDDARIEIGSGVGVSAGAARAWIRGGLPLGDELDWLAEQPTSEVEERMRERLERGLTAVTRALVGEKKLAERAADDAWEVQVGEQIRRHDRKEKS